MWDMIELSFRWVISVCINIWYALSKPPSKVEEAKDEQINV
jgi:hypothetical protein